MESWRGPTGAMSNQTIQLPSARGHKALSGLQRRVGYWDEDCREPPMSVQRACKIEDWYGTARGIGRYLWNGKLVCR